MEAQSPYQASHAAMQVADPPRRAHGLPKRIGTPIKHMWVLGFVLAGFALLFSALLGFTMYRRFLLGDVSLVAVLLTAGTMFADGVVYSGLAWGVRRNSRVAASCLLGYYLVGQAMFMMQDLGYAIVRVAIIVVVTTVFVRGTRASFAYHRHRHRLRGPAGRVADPVSTQ